MKLRFHNKNILLVTYVIRLNTLVLEILNLFKEKKLHNNKALGYEWY